MRRRWYYIRRAIRADRPWFTGLAAVLFLLVLAAGYVRKPEEAADPEKDRGLFLAREAMKEWLPAAGDREKKRGLRSMEPAVFSYLETLGAEESTGADPAYERMLAEKMAENGREGSGRGPENEGTASGGPGNAGETPGENGNLPEKNGEAVYEAQKKPAEPAETSGETAEETGTPGDSEKNPGAEEKQKFLLGKLDDYDYMMQNFYSVHPTTTAGRELMNAEKFLIMDLSLEGPFGEEDGRESGEKDAGAKKTDQSPVTEAAVSLAAPQILIYHTHSQETFSDYPENPEAGITGVGAYLAELLREKGYSVIHDTSVYDYRDGTLDRNQAYTYALEGIQGILQEHPSVEVVLDLHRDGVDEDVRLVTETGGKKTAKIMFFNGTSQTPEGPIEYLPNPNRDANLAFSFQMQLKAAEMYPGFTRKIYLKGLRYNQHVRARSALVEVGAQTNTYEEARNAMEPLAEILDQVLRPVN